ncbi:hypothetical protein SAMN02799630_01448 [Paenibacillus sp. UNCCL117]|uniref:hypothetical protein n=1 Tax=unclassified Paenibacillus TaxID=185978 RepID=UPI000890E6D4|nr:MULTISPECIES: hypothetical protein [unclassified Paenibacillus]SDC77415.1 hypothetical protein SAMN04488602_103427 [Paenibacillus sp. cl123]SFW25819.1 hypothetical protein SAMN02799630_01448 [Paenibacillus sp. UNCCL117]
MKIMITAQEAMERGIWLELMQLFGLHEEDTISPGEQFILTEEQAIRLELIRT